MSIEYLVTTTNCDDIKSLISKMNIQDDILIGNQTTFNKIDFLRDDNRTVQVYSFNEKGVSLNRNNLLMRARKDYIVFCD